MPQFLIYIGRAKEAKALQPNLKNINEYISAIFNKKSRKIGKNAKSSTPTMQECKRDFESVVNNWDNIIEAKRSLEEKTGRNKFSMNEIVSEINILDKGRTLKYKINKSGVDGEK